MDDKCLEKEVRKFLPLFSRVRHLTDFKGGGSLIFEKLCLTFR